MLNDLHSTKRFLTTFLKCILGIKKVLGECRMLLVIKVVLEGYPRCPDNRYLINGEFNTEKKSGAKMAPLWSWVGKVEPFLPKWGPSCGHENGSTLEPFRLHFFLSVNSSPSSLREAGNKKLSVISV